MSKTLSAAVGRGCDNHSSDVKTVQWLLNHQQLPAFNVSLAEDGVMGPSTLNAIALFQRLVVEMQHPDERVDPDGKTLLLLNRGVNADTATALPPVCPHPPLQETDYQQAAADLGIALAALKAVADVESQGNAFLHSGRPVILFEAHIFSRLTNHVFDATQPALSSATWNRALYLGGEQEYDRLTAAMALNRAAALQSASWGQFQIMGFHYSAAGFSDIDEMVTAQFTSAKEQLAAFVSFIKSQQLGQYLQTKQWDDFARRYNGESYQQNHYAERLQAAYQRHC
ncbi:N-acetylmuramidase domain-containing protein [Gallaecimonas mangrovi]|uniref:N-acetylmuramidase domain-containing protein n=1 Tax=Gallaecimonas mangrovi TaxID=2291597 RepID=UPI000E207B94|nr:N-acetylmuramidase family protein [Gallaecimonas mangrovi]